MNPTIANLCARLSAQITEYDKALQGSDQLLVQRLLQKMADTLDLLADAQENAKPERVGLIEMDPALDPVVSRLVTGAYKRIGEAVYVAQVSKATLDSARPHRAALAQTFTNEYIRRLKESSMRTVIGVPAEA